MKSFLKSVFATVVGMLIGTVVSFLIVVSFIAVAVRGAAHSGFEPIVKHSILHLKMRGQLVDKHRPLDFEIFGRRSIFTEDRTMGLWEISRAIEAAKTDERIDGIYLEIRDLNAGWANVQSLHRKLEEFKATGKWIYAYADKYDELSYYLATAANQIFIQPNGDLEFNGLGMSSPFMKGLFDKLEVEPRVFRVGKFKAAVEPFILDHMSPENRQQNEVLMGDIWTEVRKSVALSAKLDEKRVDALAAGLLVVSAEEAKAAGLFTETIFEDVLEERMKSFTVGKDEELEFVSSGELLRDSATVTKLTGRGDKKIAVVFAEGEITSGTGSRDSIGSEGLREDLLDAAADEDVEAIVLRVNSPGGDALASDVLWRELMVIDEEIPVVISMGDVAASGGYYIAAAGRHIFAEASTITGSIGVFGLMFNTEKLFKNKAGVRFDRVVTHPHADIGDSNRPMEAFEADTIQKEVGRVYKRFLDVVQEGRGYQQRSDLENIAEGRVWSGSKAKELGLVDEIGGLDQAIVKAAEFANLKDGYKVELYPQDSDPFFEFLERFSGDAIKMALGRETVSKIKAVSEAIPSPLVSLKPGVYARSLYDFKIR